MYRLFVGLMRKNSDVDLKQCGYGLARDTHVTGGPPAPMVRWRLVHHLGLGLRVSFRTCPEGFAGNGLRPWLALVGRRCHYLAH